MHHYTPTEAAEAQANALFQAQRTGCSTAITLAERQQATAGFHAHNKASEAARQYEASRLHAIGPAGREDERQAYHAY